MNTEELTHTIRAVHNMLVDLGCDIDRIGLGIIGAQSVIGSILIDEERHPRMIQSAEVDIFVLDDNDEWADYINGTLGEGSLFHTTYGYYADGVDVHSIVLPLHWKERAVKRFWFLQDKENSAVPILFIEPHDLIVSKLHASRGKDLNFTAAMKHCFPEYIDRDKLVFSCQDLPVDIKEQKRIVKLFDALTVEDINRNYRL